MNLKLFRALMALSLLLARLAGGTATAQQQNFLPAHLAFALRVEPEAGIVRLHFKVAPGYALYRDEIHVRLPHPSKTLSLQAPRFPRGTLRDDPFFGKRVIYQGTVNIDVPFKCSSNAHSIKLTVGYQGCAEAGLCYPPVTKQIRFKPAKGSCTG